MKDDIADVFEDIQRSIGNADNSSSSLMVALGELASRFHGLDYRVAVDSRNVITCVVIQTSRQRSRLREYGRLVFLDGTEGTNKENFAAFFPTVYSEQNVLQRVGIKTT